MESKYIKLIIFSVIFIIGCLLIGFLSPITCANTTGYFPPEILVLVTIGTLMACFGGIFAFFALLEVIDNGKGNYVD